MGNQSKRFTIAIIHRNGYKRLKGTLDSIIKAINNLDEIFIVDNASTDDSIKKICSDDAYDRIKIIKNSCNAGYGYASNQIMKQGLGQYFLICNNDLILPADCLDGFEETFQVYPNSGMLSGQLRDSNNNSVRTSSTGPSFFSQFDGIGRIKHNKDPRSTSKVGALRGACLALRRSAVDKVGMYDEDFFFYFEETEWCVRMNKNGWDVLLVPNIQIKHVGGASTNALYTESRIEFYRGRMLFWHKVFPRHLVIMLYLWNIPKLLIDWAFYLIATLFTFGLNIKFKKKLIDRSIVIAWLSFGRPKSWGLPGKCDQEQLDELSNQALR